MLTRSRSLTGMALVAAMAAATATVAAERNKGNSAGHFFDAPACQIPERGSDSHFSMVRGRGRADGLLGGSYGEIFFAAGAGTRGNVAHAQNAQNTDVIAAAPAPSPAAGSTPGATGGASGSSGAVSNAGSGTTTTTTTAASTTTTTGDPSAAAVNVATGSPSQSSGGSAAANTSVPNKPAGPVAIGVTPAAVNPEPATLILLGTGISGVFFARRRRNRRGRD